VDDLFEGPGVLAGGQQVRSGGPGHPATRSANPGDISVEPTTPRVTYEKFPNTTRILLTSV